MKSINVTIIRMLEARIRVLAIELEDAVEQQADENEISRIKTAIQEYRIILEDLNAA